MRTSQDLPGRTQQYALRCATRQGQSRSTTVVRSNSQETLEISEHSTRAESQQPASTQQHGSKPVEPTPGILLVPTMCRTPIIT